ncbi:hypothetical protein KCP73_22660 [Salmonella enterica subsp. enterica]|nr:hypothetical protein KCP73_22660 [Salmonella enterica subsp. enterica]
MPIDIRVRDDDIPGLVMDGVVDPALSARTLEAVWLTQSPQQGEDPLAFTLFAPFDFGGCRLSLQRRHSVPSARPRWTVNVRHPYPHLKRYPTQKGVL